MWDSKEEKSLGLHVMGYVELESRIHFDKEKTRDVVDLSNSIIAVMWEVVDFKDALY